jgi:hypothetical protein
LTVSKDTVVRRTRRLPIKGEVLVKVGDHVKADQVVARALLPGLLQTIKLAEKLGIEAKDVKSRTDLEIGASLEKGQVIAEYTGFFAKLFKTPPVVSDFTGVVENISEVTGNILVRQEPIPVDLDAYIEGHVAEVIEDEGLIVETRCAMVQGIFGVGGERRGAIKLAVQSPADTLGVEHISESDAGKILVGAATVTLDAIRKASEVGATGIIVGSIKDVDLITFLGYDIGVAITGQENINLTIIATEGFGYLPMAERTFNLLKSLDGRVASMNGATQIRAGVIRPEVIVPNQVEAGTEFHPEAALMLEIGTNIRVIREPYFGRLGTVTELPSQLMTVESETEVRVLKAKLDDGREVVVPRANVEITASS